MILRIIILSYVLLASICIGCNKVDSLVKTDCIKGKFVGVYCEGVVIKILDDNDFGTDWIGTYDSKSYKNSVVASIDTLLTKNTTIKASLFPSDSIFYFAYKDGGYPRKQYNICEPSSFITITNISISCTNDENQ